MFVAPQCSCAHHLVMKSEGHAVTDSLPLFRSSSFPHSLRCPRSATFQKKFMEYQEHEQTKSQEHEDAQQRADELKLDEQWKANNCKLCPHCHKVRPLGNVFKLWPSAPKRPLPASVHRVSVSSHRYQMFHRWSTDKMAAITWCVVPTQPTKAVATSRYETCRC